VLFFRYLTCSSPFGLIEYLTYSFLCSYPSLFWSSWGFCCLWLVVLPFHLLAHFLCHTPIEFSAVFFLSYHDFLTDYGDVLLIPLLPPPPFLRFFSPPPPPPIHAALSILIIHVVHAVRVHLGSLTYKVIWIWSDSNINRRPFLTHLE